MVVVVAAVTAVTATFLFKDGAMIAATNAALRPRLLTRLLYPAGGKQMGRTKGGVTTIDN